MHKTRRPSPTHHHGEQNSHGHLSVSVHSNQERINGLKMAAVASNGQKGNEPGLTNGLELTAASMYTDVNGVRLSNYIQGGTVNGAEVGMISAAEEINGFQGGLAGFHENVNGVVANGLASVTSGEMNGVSYSHMLNMANEANGIMGSMVANTVNHGNGIMAAPINYARESFAGLMLGGFNYVAPGTSRCVSDYAGSEPISPVFKFCLGPKPDQAMEQAFIASLPDTSLGA